VAPSGAGIVRNLKAGNWPDYRINARGLQQDASTDGDAMDFISGGRHSAPHGSAAARRTRPMAWNRWIRRWQRVALTRVYRTGPVHGRLGASLSVRGRSIFICRLRMSRSWLGYAVGRRPTLSDCVPPALEIVLLFSPPILDAITDPEGVTLISTGQRPGTASRSYGGTPTGCDQFEFNDGSRPFRATIIHYHGPRTQGVALC
jgi:hypothetical protein